MVALGYVQPNGNPDVSRFIREHPRYDKTIFYEWLADRSTPTKDIDSLCTDLGVTKAYMLLGDGTLATLPAAIPKPEPKKKSRRSEKDGASGKRS